jgi:hypothetical protein
MAMKWGAPGNLPGTCPSFRLPDQFIPVAEDSGLIVELGEWVLNRACTDAVVWDPPLRLSVNVTWNTRKLSAWRELHPILGIATRKADRFPSNFLYVSMTLRRNWKWKWVSDSDPCPAFFKKTADFRHFL